MKGKKNRVSESSNFLSVLIRTVAVVLLTFLVSCNALEDALNGAPLGSLEQFLEQGTIHVDDTGNIEVVFNNLEFATNPLFSEASYISVWVYKRGGDARVRCCTGSSDCPQLEQDSCLIGVGFSNDLNFAGDRYLNLHIPRPFNKYATSYFMPVYVADKEGTPTNYQGAYNDFSSPVNAVGDRELYTVYLGVFYNVFGGLTGLRIKSPKTTVGTKEIYSPVSPDYLSPPIYIETRFYPQSQEDPPGSVYAIPHLASWTPNLGGDLGLFNRGSIRINEIGNAIGGTTANDFIELYNPTSTNVPLEGVYLYRWTDSQCDSPASGETTQSLGDVVIPAGGYYVLSRSGNTLSNVDGTFNSSINNVSGNDCWALVFGNDTVFSPTDSSVIDFVGINSSGNQYEGTSAAPLISSANTALSRCPNGTDTNNNGSDFQRRTSTPGAANSCPGTGSGTTSVLDLNAGDLLITEYHYDVDTGSGFEGGGGTLCTEADDEFVEILNNTSNTVDMTNASLFYITGSGATQTKVYTFPSGYTLAAGARVVIVDQDAGCYTSSNLSSYNVLFASGAFTFSATSGTIALMKDNTSISATQTGPALSPGANAGILDYLGTGTATVYEGSPQNPDCANTSSVRTSATTDTDNNAADFSCGGANGTPGH